MAAFGIVFANRSGFLGRLLPRTGQAIHQCRFADTRGADQRHCLPLTAPRPQMRGDILGAGIHHDDGQTALEGRCLPKIGSCIGHSVSLGEHDHRVGPSLICQRQIAFQPRWIELGIA